MSGPSGFDVNRGDYYDLFTVYNTTFGVGDGSANFGVIDLPKTHYLEGTTILVLLTLVNIVLTA